MINQDKATLRKYWRNVRGSISDIEDKSQSIYELMVSSDFYKDAKTVLLYWSVDSEVCTHRMIDKALSDGKKVALPKCVDSDGNMVFYCIGSTDELVDGMYGIKEPPVDSDYDMNSSNSVCVVPALCFSNDGFRLGYGKGYYDRFLEKFNGISVGLCYDECLTESLPVGIYDKKVNYIITNKRIYEIK